MFSAHSLVFPLDRKVFYLLSKRSSSGSNSKECATSAPPPIVAMHGLGGASTFWIPAFTASGLLGTRDVYLLDLDGHGQSEWSGRDLTIDDLVEDLEEVITALGLEKVVLVGHSMNGIVTSIFSERHPSAVECLILIHPVRNLAPPACERMRQRADAAATVSGLGDIANSVASGAVSRGCAASDHAATALVRHLVASTRPAAYAAACIALARAPIIDGTKLRNRVKVHLIGGEEDYLAGPEAVRAWAEEAGGLLAPSSYFLLLGTFRSPFIYTLSFDVPSRRLSLLHANAAVSGHSWLDVSGSKRVLYTTGWSDPPAVSAYSIALPTPTTPHPTVELLQSVPSKYLSGYVCSNGKAVYSACGPQVDVFELDDAGSLKMQPAVQSFALVAEEDRHKGATQLDFGGLRHGGHSCDLSPCGTKLYVADIGRNCVWLYHVDPSTGYLTESSKNAARRQHDGPRHAWPHPNGRIVYSLQEHSSHVDVLQLSADDNGLEWLEGVSILPEGRDCKLFWADEVRLSPSADILFASTRGLEPHTKGYVVAWSLTPSGRLAVPALDGDDTSLHRFETRTSGGWANAIAVCPELGPRGEVFLTLTDSEEGFVQVLSYTRDEGFEVLDEVPVGSSGEHVGASVAVWL
ncbi:hypothetical protein EHS25_000844 [Saitozyma podzolica]|uniref:AB hydrolase-1 domain-containing protein n=1 Tax=Saitozyma podzolica TaxID=1890683 RepID=A0A427YXE9_9TREE|nr:hypothetical protein EHS25_000844 [Saitozyma podzolica]